MCLEGMDRSRRQRTALQIDPSTAAAREGPGAEDPMETKGRHLVIRLQPRSRREAVLGEREGAVLIAVQAPPVDGAANAALLRLLAIRLRLPHPGAWNQRPPEVDRPRWTHGDGGATAANGASGTGPFRACLNGCGTPAACPGRRETEGDNRVGCSQMERPVLAATDAMVQLLANCRQRSACHGPSSTIASPRLHRRGAARFRLCL